MNVNQLLNNNCQNVTLVKAIPSVASFFVDKKTKKADFNSTGKWDLGPLFHANSARQSINALPFQWKKFSFWTQDDTIYLYEFLIAHRQQLWN